MTTTPEGVCDPKSDDHGKYICTSCLRCSWHCVCTGKPAVERVSHHNTSGAGASEQDIAFWDAVNRYVVACGGDPSKRTVSSVRMTAVSDIERQRRRADEAGDADQPRKVLLGQSLRQRAHQLRRDACAAWSDVVIPPYAGLDQAKCELAAALEDRLRNVIDELAALTRPSMEEEERRDAERATDAVHALNAQLSVLLTWLERGDVVQLSEDDIEWLRAWFDACPKLPLAAITDAARLEGGKDE